MLTNSSTFCRIVWIWIRVHGSQWTACDHTSNWPHIPHHHTGSYYAAWWCSCRYGRFIRFKILVFLTSWIPKFISLKLQTLMSITNSNSCSFRPCWYRQDRNNKRFSKSFRSIVCGDELWRRHGLQSSRSDPCRVMPVRSVGVLRWVQQDWYICLVCYIDTITMHTQCVAYETESVYGKISFFRE